MESNKQLYDHEFTDLWQNSLSREQRRAVDRSVWRGRPLRDSTLNAVAVERARRQVKFWILQSVAGFCIVVPAAMRLWGHSGVPPLDWGLLVVGAAMFAVAIGGLLTHRRASRRAEVADGEELRRLLREGKDA